MRLVGTEEVEQENAEDAEKEVGSGEFVAEEFSHPQRYSASAVQRGELRGSLEVNSGAWNF